MLSGEEGDNSAGQAGGWEPGARPRDRGPGHTSAAAIGQPSRDLGSDWLLESGNYPDLSLVSCTALLVVARHQVCPDRGHQVTRGHT